MKFLCWILASISLIQLHALHTCTTVTQADETLWHLAVAVDQSGNSIALWVDEGLKGIYTARFDARTQSWEKNIRLSEEKNSTEFMPKIQMDSHGNAIAIWVGDHLQAAHYDAFTQQWSTLTLKDQAICRHPSIAITPEGNAAAIWYNKESNSVQASHFSVLTKTWTPPIDISEQQNSSWFFFPEKYEYRDLKVCLDNEDNALAIWVQKGEKSEVLQFAYYDKITGKWEKPNQVANCKVISGSDVFINPKGHPVFFWGAQSPHSYVHKAEYDPKRLKWVYPDKLASIHFNPIVQANSRGDSILSCLYISEEEEIYAIFEVEDDINKTLISEGGVPFFRELGIDNFGNVICTWNERYKDGLIQTIAKYSASASSWETLLRSPQFTTEPLGVSALSVHPSGYAAVLWQEYDETQKKHLIKSLTYCPE